jgi:hypothetical protein
MRPLASFLRSKSSFDHALHHYDAVVEEWIGDYETMEDYPIEEKIAQLVRQKPLRFLQCLLVIYSISMVIFARHSRPFLAKVGKYGGWPAKNGLVAVMMIGLIDVVSVFHSYGQQSQEDIGRENGDSDGTMALIEGIRWVCSQWPSPQIVFVLLALITLSLENQINALMYVLITFNMHIFCTILLGCALFAPNITRMVGLYVGLLKTTKTSLPSVVNPTSTMNDNKKRRKTPKSNKKSSTQPLKKKSPKQQPSPSSEKDHSESSKKEVESTSVYGYHSMLQFFHEMKIAKIALFLLELRILISELVKDAQEISSGARVGWKFLLIPNYIIFKIKSLLSQ